MVTSPRASRRAPQVRVDAEGITARSGRELVLDVLFDGRRIWSLWLHRDGEARGRDTFVAWPKGLVRFLDGQAQVSVVVHSTGEVLYDRAHSFGDLDPADRGGRPRREPPRHRQDRQAGQDLREPELGARRPPARRRRRGPRRPRQGRGRALPRLRHPARRGPRGSTARTRQRRGPRLRQPAHHPGRRDARVLPAAGEPGRDGLRDPALLRRRVQGEGGRGGRLDPRARRLRRLPPRRDALPDGRDPDAVPRGVGLPARDGRPRGPHASRCPPTPPACSPRPTARTGARPTRPSTSRRRRRPTAG